MIRKVFKMNRLAAILAVLAALAAGPLEARTKKGDKLLEEGRKAEAAKDYDKALDLFEQAVATDPADAAYLMSARRVRFQAAQMRVDRGQKLRAEGKLEEALAEFQKAFIIDPASTIAEQEVRRTNDMIEREKVKAKDPNAPKPEGEDRGLSPAQLARKNAEDRAANISGVPELKPISRQVTNLKLVNQPPKVLYETLGKLAGINVLFDSEYQDQGKRFSLDLTNTNLEEALDYVALLTKTFWKPLSANAVFITQDTAVKRRDYEEHVTRVFYLQNVTSAQELQEAMTAMRAITDVRKVFPFNSQSAIVVRGTVDQVALAEKILIDLDKPKPEVVVDVYVMEANKTKTRDLAATITSGGKPGFSTTITYSPVGGTASTARLNELGKISTGDFIMTVPSYFLQAVMSDRQTRLITQPQVRATDGQKATLRLGDRYPYATGSFQPGVGGVGVSPLVSTQFQFADVGVNVDLTPRIHGADEVSLQITVDITNIRERIDVGGLSQPVIGQRKVEHIIRVREGETTLIGGLMQSLRTRTRSGVPGLMQIPGLGWLFTSENKEDNDADLMVALVPHIVRAPDIQVSNLRSVASGTETIWKVSYAGREEPKAAPLAPAQPVGNLPPAAQPMINPALAPPSGQPAQPQPLPSQPAPAQAPPAGAVPPPAAEQPPGPQPPKQEAAPAVSMGGAPAVSLRPTALRLQKDATVTVLVQVENMQELFSAPMRLTYNAAVLRLLEVNKGDFLTSDGQQVVFSETKVPDQGKAIVGINRVPGAGGMSGGGTLVTLKFQAIAPGESAIGFEELTLRDAKLQPIKVAAPTTTIAVQ